MQAICSQSIVSFYGSWYTFSICMHHAEIDTYFMNTYIHTNENTHKTHTNIQTEISEINLSNPCKKTTNTVIITWKKSNVEAANKIQRPRAARGEDGTSEAIDISSIKLDQSLVNFFCSMV